MGLNAKSRRWLTLLIAVLFGIGYAAVLFIPYPQAVPLRNDRFAIKWSDGTRTEESLASAAKDLYGISETGDVLLLRDGIFGTYVSKNGVKEACGLLEEGDLAPMLSMHFSFDRLESTALYFAYGDRLYFDTGDWFSFNGMRLAVDRIGRTDTVFFAGGELEASSLLTTGARTLIVGDRAELSYKTLWGTEVAVEGRARYSVTGGVIVENTLGGILTAGVPTARELVVPDVASCAQGALLPCRDAESLSLPFVGSRPVPAGEQFRGELGYLFSDGEEFYVPSTLRSVTVRGGVLISFAFYRCPALEYIDACGVEPSAIEKQAFAGLEQLRYLHTPRADVELEAPYKFTSYTAECGCTVYERKEG